MSADPIRSIANAVLYEGYLLWPYRRSAVKNRKRWTFGGVFPEPYSRARGEDDPWWMQTECLLEAEDGARVAVCLRFLHVVGRDGDDEDTLAFDEAREREVVVAALPLSELSSAHRVRIEIPAGTELDDRRALRLSWYGISGELEIQAERRREGAFVLRAKLRNDTPWEGTDREEALKRSFVSTHTALGVEGGEFVSLLDPPPHLQAAAEACRNVHTWPVLVGEEGDRRQMLSSPIILYDYPRVAPESPSDLFDATEIDELLTLSILALTEEEKREMCATDPRARALLERVSSMSSEDLWKLHGTMRERRIVGEE